MIDDIRRASGSADLNADICIIGAGAAGLALASEFLGTRTQVIIIESGGESLQPATQQLNACETMSLPLTAAETGRGRAFGGSTKLWYGQCLPLDDIDFQRRSWVPLSGWPIGAQDLAPFYRKAEAFFGIGGEVYDERNYRRFGISPPPWRTEALRTVFTVYTPRLDTARGLAGRFRRASNIRVLLNATAVQVETDPTATRAVGLQVRAPGGYEGRVAARRIILCCGGIETARLLLASNQILSEGLGNSGGMVGRCFQEHPNGVTATVVPGNVGRLQDHFRLFYGWRIRYFPKFALSEVTQRAQQVLNCNAHLVFDYGQEPEVDALRSVLRAARRRQLPARAARTFLQASQAAGKVGPAMARRFLRGLSPRGKPQAVQLRCYLEQAPNPASRIVLSSDRDALGLRRARVDWQLTDLERKTLLVMTNNVGAEFDRLGLGRLVFEPWLAEPGSCWTSGLVDSAHHMGAVRMAYSSAEGAVDCHCRVFGVAGLYVAGSSVFPTSGYANPTLTVVALAFRLADHLRRT